MPPVPSAPQAPSAPTISSTLSIPDSTKTDQVVQSFKDQADALDSAAEAAVNDEPEVPAQQVSYEPEASSAPEVYYANCSEARAAGAAPVYANDPGYAPHLDRDHDGIGCE
jgi:Excalibur calcium-binding domain.